MRFSSCSLFVVVAFATGCPEAVGPAEGEGEGAGEGEGEGEEGEGEGEGEGEEGEGEGEEGEGEGEGEADVCFSSASCEGSDRCNAVDPDGDTFFTEGACGPAGPGAAIGAACTPQAGDCSSDLCVDNRCSELCINDSDCPNGMACGVDDTHDRDGGGAVFGRVCEADADLPVTACTRDADCAATARVCNSLDDNFNLFCGFPGQGNAFTGSCSSPFFEAPNVCQTSLCDGEAAGMCTRACASSADCGQGTICAGGIFDNVQGDYCAEPCTLDSSCDVVAGRFCSLRDNQAENGILKVCIDPPGTKTFGQAAADGTECQTNLEFNGLCTRICEPGTCAAPLPNCTSVNFTLASGAQGPISICLP